MNNIAAASLICERTNTTKSFIQINFEIKKLTNSPSMNRLCCWMISSHKCLCCSKRCTTKFFCRMRLSLSSAWDCISAFSISSSWTLQRRPRISRCSSELTLRGSSSSRRRARSRSSRNLRSSSPLKDRDGDLISPGFYKSIQNYVYFWARCRRATLLFFKMLMDKPTFCFWIFFRSSISVFRFSRATATSRVTVLSGGDSEESESFSLSSLLTLSFLLSARHFLLRLFHSCSQLEEEKAVSVSDTILGLKVNSSTSHLFLIISGQ